MHTTRGMQPELWGATASCRQGSVQHVLLPDRRRDPKPEAARVQRLDMRRCYRPPRPYFCRFFIFFLFDLALLRERRERLRFCLDLDRLRDIK